MADAPGAATFHTPAEAYDRHIGRYSRELARALIEAAGVRPGQLALDAGPSGAYASALPPERRTALEEELRRRLDVADEPFRLTARAWIATGRVRR